MNRMSAAVLSGLVVLSLILLGVMFTAWDVNLIRVFSNMSGDGRGFFFVFSLFFIIWAAWATHDLLPETKSKV